MSLKLKTKLAALALAFTAAALPLHAQITVPQADGSDGQLIVAAYTTNIINLANAGTGSWLSTSASPGNGTYDPTNWAVVFKYSNVVINANSMLTFSNHPTHAPVVWLVSGNVTINGNLNLDSKTVTTDPLNLTEPGPGGFRGGGSPLYGDGPGFGPGGWTGNATYAPNTYGNPQIIPLIGGSGGRGASGWNGGSGGGAILIVATNFITINGGYIHADGVGNNSSYSSSGGAVRLVANQINGNGLIEAVGYYGGGVGRIRLEANTVSGSITNNPVTAGVLLSNPTTIFPTNSATVTVLSVAGINAPTDPRAAMTANTSSDDLTLVTTNTVTILLQTQNFPTTGTVNVFIKQRNGFGSTQILTAAFVSGNTNSALWSVQTALPYPAHTVIQARATY